MKRDRIRIDTNPNSQGKHRIDFVMKDTDEFDRTYYVSRHAAFWLWNRISSRGLSGIRLKPQHHFCNWMWWVVRNED